MIKNSVGYNIRKYNQEIFLSLKKAHLIFMKDLKTFIRISIGSYFELCLVTYQDNELHHLQDPNGKVLDGSTETSSI